MIHSDNIKTKYKEYLSGIILRDFFYVAPVAIFIIALFLYSDINILQKPIYTYPRYFLILNVLLLFLIRFTKYKNNTQFNLSLNTGAALIVNLMGCYTLLVSFNTPLFKTAITAVIVDTIAAFLIAKNRNHIIFVFTTPVILTALFIAFYIKPEFYILRELLNPFVVYIMIFTMSLVNENSRYKEFYYKFSLQEQNNEIEMLYEETLAQNNTLEQQKEEILTINEQLHQKSEELTLNLEVITDLNNTLKLRNKNITDSINYARRIQEGVLPAPEIIQTFLPEHFLLFLPCQIVSGDFYWIKQVENVKILAIADCTGHGVPGAFMSLLGNALLNEIVANNADLNANDILNRLKIKLSQSLHLEYNQAISHDGMDIAVVKIDTQTHTMQYSGAHLPLVIIRGNELTSIKPDLMPIGKYIKEKQSFTNHEFKVFSSDVCYLYSDGYQDQIGGEGRKRFLSKNFKNLLLQNYKEPMVLQKQILNDTLESWRLNIPQLDDILVFGFKPLA